MRSIIGLCSVLWLGACDGLALNTRVAETPASRAAMAVSVIPGVTTEQALITIWGRPVQLIREGGQTAFVYRKMWNPRHVFPLPNYGDSTRWVIVTFQYGLAVSVLTSDEVSCRATFAPRPPNYTFDNPTEVRLVGQCAPQYAPRSGAWGRLIGLETKSVPPAEPPQVPRDGYSGGKGRFPK